MKERAKISKGNLLFGLLFLAVLGLLLRRLPYGGVTDDEAFYLSVPWQMAQGSAPVLHQWNPAQMFGFLLMPLMRLHRALFPGGEGMVLHFRLLWLLLHALTALYIYLRLRQKDPLGAAASALVYLFFLFMGFPCLGYNSMCVALMLFAGLTAGCGTGRRREAWLEGFAFAGAVLCCPTLLLLYLLYTLAVFALRLLRRPAPDPALQVGSWLRFTAACGVLAALFFLYIACYGDLRLLAPVFPHLLTLETHLVQTPCAWALGFLRTLRRSNAWSVPLLLGGAALTAAIMADRDRKARRGLYLLLAAALTLVFALPYLLMFRAYNYMIFPLNLLGFFAFLLCEKREKKLFGALFVPGLVYWACIDMASDLGFSSIAGASAVNMPCSLLCIARLLREMWAERKAGKALRRAGTLLGMAAAAAVVCALSLSLVHLAYTKDACGRRRWLDDTAIAHGAAAGLRTDAETAEAMEREYAALQPLREKTEGNVLYLARNSLRFLEDPKLCVSNNLWFAYTTPEKAFEQLETYWALFPERRPDYVYLTDILVERGYLEGFAAYPHAEEDVGTGIILTMDWSVS